MTAAPMDVGQSIQQAVTLAQGGRLAEAIGVMERAAREHPGSAQALALLGTLLSSAGRAGEAIEPLRRAHELAAKAPHIAYSLGAALVSVDRPLEGLPFMQRAVDLDGSWLPGLLGFGRALRAVGDFDRAEGAFRRALALDARNAEVQASLAGMLIGSGRVAEAVELFRRTAREHPENAEAWGRLASALNYAGDGGAEEAFEAHRRWGQLVMARPRGGGSGSGPARFDNERDPEKRLRVGVLSTDLWDHSCAYFLRPILRARDAGRVEFICYSAGGTADWMTAELREAADGWRDVAALGEGALAERARADRLDILVELNGHTAQGPLAALRQRVAPVQATYLGYPNTTGLPTIDYRIVDGWTDPPGAERWCTERLVRLEGCFLCYSPPARADERGATARAPGSPVTFGSFNSIRKLGPGVIRLWARLLREAPGTRLLIKTRGIGTPAAQRHFRSAFEAEGVEASRLELMEGVPDKTEHLGLYSRVDIGLDTFPYNGTTTTCEAMWMGVPVVVLEGSMHAGRVGVSLLHAARVPDLVAADADGYVALARGLAADPARLASLKASLRDRVRGSMLCDAAGFAGRFEGALRGMWRAWVAGDSA